MIFPPNAIDFESPGNRHTSPTIPSCRTWKLRIPTFLWLPSIVFLGSQDVWLVRRDVWPPSSTMSWWLLVKASICKTHHLDPQHLGLLVGQPQSGHPRNSAQRPREVQDRPSSPVHDDHRKFRLGPHSREHRPPLAEERLHEDDPLAPDLHHCSCHVLYFSLHRKPVACGPLLLLPRRYVCLPKRLHRTIFSSVVGVRQDHFWMFLLTFFRMCLIPRWKLIPGSFEEKIKIVFFIFQRLNRRKSSFGFADYSLSFAERLTVFGLEKVYPETWSVWQLLEQKLFLRQKLHNV